MKIKALSDYKSFDALEEEGIWFPMAADVEFKIRRMRSKAVERARERIYGPVERVMRGKDIPDEMDLKLTKKLLSEAVISDWRGKGMVDDEGAAIPFSTSTCYQILDDPETGRDIRSTVITASMDGTNYRPDSEDSKEDEKN